MRFLLIMFAIVPLWACAVPKPEQPSEMPTLNEIAQSHRFAAFQDAMEKSQGDQSVRWQASAEIFGTIAPLDTVFSSTDGWCRSYEEAIANGVRRYRVVGIACRNAPRRWLVLDVRPFGRGP